ncbi:hypothetical protein EJ05DRAFT_334334 [Pseudovirgaria hyperparasitica]|uniref:Uncharacterized protein n=1 Tax=Pseudovirgaria hyperparasitica TaxID=470096 RepID=A0A6A6W908_9PEZI|nr:uncharacterized protein EJ05DRAFT_334334 [Pseudovirgaria hyperparasitica]KAF2759143.1 hypothetical protein EJ05DRAFT_334334 [Pseudovirgaria hyperparasitica]
MEISETIAERLESLLSDVCSSFADTSSKFKDIRNAARGGSTDAPDVTENFQDALLLKQKLDLLEAGAVTGSCEPSLPILARILHCEYLLYSIYAETPMRYNPFLSHWVEVIQRLDRKPESMEISKITSKSMSWPLIHRVRVLLVQQILHADTLMRISHQSPRDLLETLSELELMHFVLDDFVRILEDEDIYERSQSPEAQSTTGSTAQSSYKISTGSQSNSQIDIPIDNTKEGILRRIKESSHPVETADKIIARLPVDLNTLELLTGLLQNGTLESLRVDSLNPIRNYIQHGLRHIEKMGQRQTVIPDTSLYESNDSIQEQGEVGREAQRRSVKLLVLFMRNLVRKALIPPEELYYEIQEICVRYMWIREVRDFRAFMEGMG